MQEQVKFYVIFVQADNAQGEKEFFPITYSGIKILWDYLVEIVEEEFHVCNVSFNGYNEISEQEYNRLRLT